MPAIYPRPGQFAKFRTRKPEGSLYMLNLLKFKDKAVYADGRATELSGAEAYGIYAVAVTKIIEAIGGGPVWDGTANALVIGDGELAWDSVSIMRYPSFEHFAEMTRSEPYQEIHVHREAGLEHQLLINCFGQEQVDLFLKAAPS